MPRQFVNLANTRQRPGTIYKNIISKIREDGVCPFCPQYLKKYHKRPIIKTSQHWILTENMYPYQGTTHHLLFIHKKHIEHIAELSPAAWQELSRLAAWVTKKRAIKGGALVMRFGNTAYTGASVSHLHAGIIAGPGERTKHTPIMFRVG